MHPKASWTSLILDSGHLTKFTTPKTTKNVSIHLPSNQSVWGGGELRRKRLGKEIGWEMNQSDKGPEGNEEVCSTTEVQYAEKNG